MTPDTTNEKHLSDPGKEPGHWLRELAEATADIAWGVANIVWFDPANERETAADLDSTPPDEQGDTGFLRRLDIRLLHGKTGQDRENFQRRQKKFESYHMTGQEYLQGTALELVECWPVTIHRTTDLLKEIIAQKEEVFLSPVIAPVQDIVREVLARLVTINEEGMVLIGRWKETLAIDGFSDEDRVEELFDDAAVFAEHLRNHNLQTDLEKLANRIKAHWLTQSRAEGESALLVVEADRESDRGDQYLFRNEGATWRIIYEGQEITVRDFKGVRYIHHLMGNAGTTIECLDIESACNGEPERDIRAVSQAEAVDAGIGGSRLDPRQLDKFEVKELEEARDALLAKAGRPANPAQQMEYTEQAEHLTTYLRKRLNKRGEGRFIGEKEKARKRVGNAVSRAKRAITEDNQLIGIHLQAIRAREGTFVYEPDHAIAWTFA